MYSTLHYRYSTLYSGTAHYRHLYTVEYSPVPDEGPVPEFLDEVNDEEAGQHEDLPDGQLGLGQNTAQHCRMVQCSQERCSKEQCS